MSDDDKMLILPPDFKPAIFGALIVASGIYGMISTSVPAWVAVIVIIMGVLFVSRIKKVTIQPHLITVTHIALGRSKRITKEEINSIHIAQYKPAFGTVNKTLLIRLYSKKNVVISSTGLYREGVERMVQFLHRHYAGKIH